MEKDSLGRTPQFAELTLDEALHPDVCFGLGHRA